MNYGKTAYLKVLDIEKEISQSSLSENYTNCFEISKPNINQIITYSSPYSLNLDNISVIKNKGIYFQLKITLHLTNEAETTFELLANNCIIHSETKLIGKNESDSILIKTYTPLTTGIIPIGLNIFIGDQNAVVTVKSVTAVILGASGESCVEGVELRALDIPFNNKILISYIDNNELYYTEASKINQSFRSEDFKFLLPAKSHCFCLEKFPTETEPSPDIILYRVDHSGNLYYSKAFSGEVEILIDKNIDCVFASPCPLVSDDFNIITYIKDGKCYFRTMRESGVINEKEFILPSGKYTDIRVISKEDSEHIYVVATNENGSNYILHSLVEVSTGKITEFLSATYSLLLSKYIDLSFAEKLSTETIKMNLDCVVEPVSYIPEMLERICNSHIRLECELYAEKYQIVGETTYGVSLDKSILIGTEWGSYTDDAIDFEPAYMDFDNDTFVDNGWTNRWPFNEIKPCMLKDGKVIGYLDPNDYSKFEDGSESYITSYPNHIWPMVEIPKMYFSITRDDNYINVKISNKPKEGFVCTPFVYKGEELDKIYVSVYLNEHSKHSTNGYFTASNTMISALAAIAYTKAPYDAMKNIDGERFEFLPYNVLMLLQCLYIIMFRNTDAQKSLGFGYANERTSHRTGYGDQKGMYYGEKTNGVVKFLGIEDLYGARRQMVTGFYIDLVNKVPRFIDPYDKNSSYAPDDISTYISSDKPFTIGYRFIRNAIDINEDANNIGFFASADSSDRTLGFCDGQIQTTLENSSVDFGWTGTGNNNGMFAQSTITTGSATTSRSVRLVYYPE